MIICKFNIIDINVWLWFRKYELFYFVTTKFCII